MTTHNLTQRVEELERRRQPNGITLPLVILDDADDVPGQRDGETLQAACARLGYNVEMARRRRRLVATEPRHGNA